MITVNFNINVCLRLLSTVYPKIHQTEEKRMRFRTKLQLDSFLYSFIFVIICILVIISTIISRDANHPPQTPHDSRYEVLTTTLKKGYR